MKQKEKHFSRIGKTATEHKGIQTTNVLSVEQLTSMQILYKFTLSKQMHCKRRLQNSSHQRIRPE